MLHVGIAHLAVHFLSLLEQLQKIDALQITSGKLGSDGKGTCGQDQLVIGFLIGFSIGGFTVNHFFVKIDAFYGGFHPDVSAFGFKGFLIGIEQIFIGVDLASYPQRGTASQIAEIGVPVDHHNLLIRIIVQKGVGCRNTGMVCTNDQCFHKCITSKIIIHVAAESRRYLCRCVRMLFYFTVLYFFFQGAHCLADERPMRTHCSGSCQMELQACLSGRALTGIKKILAPDPAGDV